MLEKKTITTHSHTHRNIHTLTHSQTHTHTHTHTLTHTHSHCLFRNLGAVQRASEGECIVPGGCMFWNKTRGKKRKKEKNKHFSI